MLQGVEEVSRVGPVVIREMKQTSESITENLVFFLLCSRFLDF